MSPAQRIKAKTDSEGKPNERFFGALAGEWLAAREIGLSPPKITPEMSVA